MNDPKRTVSRRQFLERMSFAAVAAGTVIVSGRADPAHATRSAPADDATVRDDGDSCTDVSNLSAEQKKTRKSLQYVDDSPHAEKRCNNCRLFKAPEEGSECGTCQVVPGPIHPKGYCIAWAAVTN